jgi:hypothetical protein
MPELLLNGHAWTQLATLERAAGIHSASCEYGSITTMLTRREFSNSVPQVSLGTLAVACIVPRQALFNYPDQSSALAYDLMTAARERGILFDVAHGICHFGFDLRNVYNKDFSRTLLAQTCLDAL